MFVRKKKNRSGSVSIVVVDKSRGRFREVRQFGVAHTEAEADALYTQAREWIRRYAGQQTIDFGGGAVASENDVDMLVSRIDGVSINGTQLLLNRIYDSVGFNRIKDDVLRHLVVARISQPSSKLATTSYLRSYFKEDIDLSRIYRYMDKLYNSQMELVQEISITHTRSKFLEISKDVEVTISQERIAEDERWDGLKGYVTNTDLRREDVIDQYHGLWVVEKAFRVSKGNLEMCPIFHFTERRIEAHICICFVAYKVYKELERAIRHAGIAISVDKVLDIAKTIITIDVRTDGVRGVSKRTLFLTEEQKAIKQLFEMDTTKDD